MPSFRKNFSKLASGAVIAQGIALISSPIITRIYTPDDYGILGLYIAISTILVMISTGRYHVAIVLPKNDNDANSLLILCIIIVLITAFISIPLFYHFDEVIASALNAESLSNYLWLIPITVMIRGTLISLQYWCTRNKEFGLRAISDISESATGSGSTITIGMLLGSSVYGLIGSRILSGLVSTSYLILTGLLPKLAEIKHAFSLHQIKRLAVKYVKFPLVSIWAALLNTIAYVAPILLLSFFFSPIVVGFYTLADRVVISPMTIISNTLSQVIYQRSSELHNSQKAYSSLISNVTDILFTIAFYPAVLIAIFGENIFLFIFSTHWAEAGVYAQILSLYALSRFIAAPLINICMIHDKQEIDLYFNSILSFCRISSVIIGGVYSSIYTSLILLSLSSAFAYSILLVWLYKISGSPIMAFIKNSMKVIISFSIPILFSVYIKIMHDSISIIALSLIISAIMYLGIVYKLEKHLFNSIFPGSSKQ